ncbi:type I polyketide synthase [Piscinibacter gummiphilus]|uniref:Polyketide synthase n=1 Tax=Piscinibacter gummiphilus TaxID=946333 RepID=A0A1W6L7P7_9BURK|nr:type I polyketide synthase [Piscinibacter gummiphilus]ARN20325.1 polyketide synthase [Piscinibacter gummiphilus]ATU64997.1 polyketide synthase [Piscinibacter gummiphilus]GLS96363.1 polyketide synthase [Piscinibacter gummiphilus]
MNPTDLDVEDTDIAVVGMACRFPGASDVDTFWANVRDGVESIETWTEAELRERGVPEAVLRDPQHVRAGAPLPGVDQFDAGFFGYSPREAEEMDPQHRLFLEVSWQALEHAGYDGGTWGRPIGVYGGVGVNTYLLRHLMPSGRFSDFSDISSLQGLMNGNNKDSMTTTVAYKLNLRGPAVTVQTACSTSLASVHVACRGLLNHEADMALAGGVWVNLLHDGGYRHQPGAILSSDGHCRAFDARATGTVIGSGAGIVVLKRLADALADGDTVHAIVKGSAMNNDGSAKVGYTAPSVEGQAEVILAAQAMAGVDPRSIGCIEAHGTGTTMGDPIEITALTQAFRAGTGDRNYCAIGSVKTNVGHLDAAAGVAGFIKAALALRHRTLPPSLHFQSPNPQIDFASSPFYVNTTTRPWPAGDTPRRAGVSSFGIGGTNVHVVLQEAPLRPVATGLGRWQLLPVSARTPAALDAALARLGDHVARHDGQRIEDVARTLQTGRKAFPRRAVALVRGRDDAVDVLARRDPRRFHAGVAPAAERPSVVFMFPGQGSQHVGMARDLYETEPVFRAAFDRCADGLRNELGLDLRTVVHPAAPSEADAVRLSGTALTQPALFAVEYALARLWTSWGVVPQAMIGHSIGEYVAACLAGVFSLDDALKLVAARGRLLQALPTGAMLAVNLPEADVAAWRDRGCDVAAVNAPQSCVLSGPSEAIAEAERALAAQGVAVQRLQVSHAFHSAMVEPAEADLEALVAGMVRGAPSIPFVSNVTGRWITATEAADPRYWSRHLRGTVRFADGLSELLREPGRVFLEVGPGESLTQLTRRHPAAGAAVVVSSQPHPRQADTAADHLPLAAGRLWAAGVALDWDTLAHGEARRRVPLPSYPFERQSYWIPAGDPGAVRSAGPQDLVRSLDDWFHVPTWRRAGAASTPDAVDGTVLVFGDAGAGATAVVDALKARGAAAVVRVEAAGGFEFIGGDRALVAPGEGADVVRLLAAVRERAGPVRRVVHLWNAEVGGDVPARGFLTLTALARALDEVQPGEPVALDVVTRGLADVTGDEPLDPRQALLVGPGRVLPQEHSSLSCRLIDLGVLPLAGAAMRVAAEVPAADEGLVVAYRGAHRWVQSYTAVARPASPPGPWRDQGIYLITGGLGGVGLALAEHLARTVRARLVLVGRSAPDAARQQAVDRLRGLGADVLVLEGDVAEPGDARRFVVSARERFGALHGVVHAAGIAGGGLAVDATAVRLAGVLAAKVAGTDALQAALGDEPLDFLMLCSSLATVAGGLRKVDYTAANAYLDVTALRATRGSPYPVVSVNWDSWRDVGMAGAMAMPDGVGIRPADGVLACERILAAPLLPQVIVSTVDLAARLDGTRGDLLAGPLVIAAADRGTGHARPALTTPFEAPDGELEETIAGVWRTMLGIAEIGRFDNLFELGGDSLLGIQILSKVRAVYAVELHPAPFFKHPTVEALAGVVENLLLDEIERQDLATAP